MSTTTLIQKIDAMPDELKQQISDFVDSLAQKHDEQQNKKKTPKFGSHPGVFQIAPDFDEPLEEFSEHME
jgi:ABC-type phosphate/phosphonate transport system substrate-binding protein